MNLRDRIYNTGHDIPAKYKLSQEDFEAMLHFQGGCCKICSKRLHKRAIDHCHVCGVVRGILCSSCNAGLGFFKDEPKLLARAIIYLEDARCDTDYH